MELKEFEEKVKQYKILIVDDEHEVLKSLLLTLKNSKEFDSVVSTANNAQVALEKMMKEDFDLVLADYKMPGMNGLELLLKVNEKYPKVAKILITGYSDINLAETAIDSSKLDCYIEKPWHNQKLRRIVIETLKRKKNKKY